MIAPPDVVAYFVALERRLAELEAKAGTAPTHYSQAEGHRPAWLPTRVLFLRAWRERRDAGDAGAIAAGKARVLTREAAERWLAKHRDEPVRAARVVQARNVDAELDAALGIRTRVGGRR